MCKNTLLKIGWTISLKLAFAAPYTPEALPSRRGQSTTPALWNPRHHEQRATITRLEKLSVAVGDQATGWCCIFRRLLPTGVAVRSSGCPKRPANATSAGCSSVPHQPRHPLRPADDVLLLHCHMIISTWPVVIPDVAPPSSRPSRVCCPASSCTSGRAVGEVL